MSIFSTIFSFVIHSEITNKPKNKNHFGWYSFIDEAKGKYQMNVH